MYGSGVSELLPKKHRESKPFDFLREPKGEKSIILQHKRRGAPPRDGVLFPVRRDNGGGILDGAEGIEELFAKLLFFEKKNTLVRVFHHVLADRGLL